MKKNWAKNVQNFSTYTRVYTVYTFLFSQRVITFSVIKMYLSDICVHYNSKNKANKKDLWWIILQLWWNSFVAFIISVLKITNLIIDRETIFFRTSASEIVLALHRWFSTLDSWQTTNQTNTHFCFLMFSIILYLKVVHEWRYGVKD